MEVINLINIECFKYYSSKLGEKTRNDSYKSDNYNSVDSYKQESYDSSTYKTESYEKTYKNEYEQSYQNEYESSYKNDAYDNNNGYGTPLNTAAMDLVALLQQAAPQSSLPPQGQQTQQQQEIKTNGAPMQAYQNYPPPQHNSNSYSNSEAHVFLYI